MIQVVNGTQLKMEGKIFTCTGLWCLGNKVMRYDFKTESGFEFTRKADYIQDLLKNKTIEKI